MEGLEVKIQEQEQLVRKIQADKELWEELQLTLLRLPGQVIPLKNFPSLAVSFYGQEAVIGKYFPSEGVFQPLI